ncbi:alpha/beta fold hydrolase [Paramicrobacterium chengjingii]|uniref:Alpha/beta fold hydrolase n=1 Tax=Paramicrobacterium chengjingii TaxID=2769067 RepID=A0ABX6YL06_9MICO|nr:alpha/beta fold hydrolase [Microbacterium chengjingii]QPZ39432.1 alpha/beta fold hydrolase [Microbacterium chengjingii]
MALIIRKKAPHSRVGRFRSITARRAYTEAYDDAFSALPAPSSTHDIPTTFGTVRAYSWSALNPSSRAPVILLPGRAAATPMWYENIPELVKNRPVIALDMLGDAGMSQQRMPFRSTRDHGTWLREVQTRLAPGGAHVVGHSFGGSTAAAFARAHPEIVTSLTLLEPVLTVAFPPLRMMLWTTLFSLPVLPQAWRATALARVGGSDDEDAGALGRMISLGVEEFRATLPVPRPMSTNQLARLTMPVYVGLAEHHSLAGRPSTAQRARAALPNSEVTIWSGTTHSLPMQVPVQLAQVLDDFWTHAEEHDRRPADNSQPNR